MMGIDGRYLSPDPGITNGGGANNLTLGQEVVTTDIVLKDGFVSGNIQAHNEIASPDRQIFLIAQKVKGVGKFDFYSRDGRTITFSGLGSRNKEGKPLNGVVGTGGKSIEGGQEAARGAAQNFLNNLLGSGLGQGNHYIGIC